MRSLASHWTMSQLQNEINQTERYTFLPSNDKTNPSISLMMFSSSSVNSTEYIFNINAAYVVATCFWNREVLKMLHLTQVSRRSKNVFLGFYFRQLQDSFSLLVFVLPSVVLRRTFFWLVDCCCLSLSLLFATSCGRASAVLPSTPSHTGRDTASLTGNNPTTVVPRSFSGESEEYLFAVLSLVWVSI